MHIGSQGKHSGVPLRLSEFTVQSSTVRSRCTPSRSEFGIGVSRPAPTGSHRDTSGLTAGILPLPWTPIPAGRSRCTSGFPAAGLFGRQLPVTAPSLRGGMVPNAAGWERKTGRSRKIPPRPPGPHGRHSPWPASSASGPLRQSRERASRQDRPLGGRTASQRLPDEAPATHDVNTKGRKGQPWGC